MVIKNLTEKVQKVLTKEITGFNREFEVFLEPNGSTTLDLMVVVDPKKYEGIIEIDGIAPVVEKSTKVVEEIIPEERVVEEVIEEIVEEPTVEQAESEDFICDICGAEFASARGLATHKHKAHE